MAYFPFFIDIAGLPGLIVGGGPMARRKIEKLLPYGPKLTVAAAKIPAELRSVPGLTLLERPFDPSLLDGMAFAVSAAGSRDGNHAVSLACRARSIPVNVVDEKDDCTFLFPALVRRGSLSVGISTAGASPTAAVWLKERINALLPEDFDGILAALEAARETAKAALPQDRRRDYFAALLARSLEAGGPLEAAEAEALLESYRREAES